MASPEVAIIVKCKDQASGVLSGIGDKLGGLGKMAGIGAAAGVAALAGLSVGILKIGMDFNISMEQSQIAFTTMLGSADAAKAHLAELIEFAKKTPFEQAGVIDASKRLLAFGFAATEVVPMLTSVGDAAAGLGMGTEGVNRIVLALGQMKAKAKISGGEMMQLTEAGIPAWQILAEAMGKSTSEVMALSEKGLIPADAAIQQLIDGMEKRFPNMMEKQSKSFAGMMSTLKDTMTVAMGKIVAPIFERLQPALASIVDWISRPEFDALITKVADGIGGAMGLAGDIIKKVAGWVSNSLVPAFERWLPVIGSIATEIGDKVVPVLKTFGEKIKQAWDVIDGIVGKKALIAGVLAVIAVAFGALAISAGSAAIGVVVALAPIIAIAAVIAGVGALIYKAWTENWGGIQEKTAAVVGNIVGKVTVFVNEMKIRFDQFVAFIKPLMGPAWANIKSAMTNIVKFFEENWDKVEKIFTGVWKVIQGIVRVAWDVVSGIIKIGMSLLAGDWDKAWTALKDMLSNIWDDIKLVISGATDVIGTALDVAWSVITIAANWAWRGVKDVILGVWEGIKSGIQTACQWILDHTINPLGEAVNALIDIFNALPGPDISYKFTPWTLGGPTAASPSAAEEKERFRRAAGEPEAPPLYEPYGPPEIAYQYGTWRVPGPLGMPVRAIVHGGEEILTPRQRQDHSGPTFNFDFRGADLGGLTEERVEQIFKEAALQERLQGIRY